MFARRQKSPSPVRAVPLNRKHQSRIVDSDDEDTPPRAGNFRSRFADDSDDEADVGDLTPVRGIPRRGDGNDSTDLEDSSGDEQPAAAAPSRVQIAPDTASAMGDEPWSPGREKKRGLFGRLRGKKAKDEMPSPGADSPRAPPKVDASKPSQLGFSSTAERDRVIEETRVKLEAANEQPRVRSPQPHGKLQRRHQPQRMMSDSWPLPPKLPDSINNRPNTSDGAPFRNGSTRLTQGSMRPREPEPPLGAKAGKKKKFPMLRKAFGLKD